MLKKVLAMSILVGLMSGSAMAHAEETTINTSAEAQTKVEAPLNMGDLLKATKDVVYMQKVEFKRANMHEGGKRVYEGWSQVDNFMGAKFMVTKNDELSIASRVADKPVVTSVVADKLFCYKLAQEMMATTQATMQRKMGQVYRYMAVDYQVSDYDRENLEAVGITYPVQMVIIAEKIKDPQTPLIKGVKGVVTLAGFAKAVKDYDSDYADFTPFLTSAMMLQSLLQKDGSGVNPLMGGVMLSNQQIYAMNTSAMSYGFGF